MLKIHISLILLSLLGLQVLAGCGKMSSTVSGTSGRKLTLVAPADQSLNQGDNNKVALAIVRQNFEDAVEIEISELPKGVTVAGGTKLSIPSGMLKTDTITLVAEKDATVVNDHRVRVTAKGPEGISVTEFFNLTVRVPN